jgi:Peptidase family M23
MNPHRISNLRTHRTHRLAGPVAVCALLLSGNAAALDASKGVYRIPYANGTEIKIGRDHIDHTPPGRIDMNGRGGGPYKIVAAADGFVRHVVDGFDKRLDCGDLPANEQKNNYVWIEHANGEWTKYSHMRKGSSSGKAKLKVGQFVKAGTYLGDEGEVGCAGGEHLHFEVGVPKASGGITTIGGFLTDNDGSKRNRIPRVCGIGDGRFASGEVHKAREVPGAIKAGAKEYATDCRRAIINACSIRRRWPVMRSNGSTASMSAATCISMSCSGLRAARPGRPFTA